jgi:hypothetical protein
MSCFKKKLAGARLQVFISLIFIWDSVLLFYVDDLKNTDSLLICILTSSTEILCKHR